MNTLKSEHLHPWEKPIQICFDYVKKEMKAKILYHIWINRWVDWYSWTFRNKILWNINPEQDSYVISPINWKNKISRWYYDCTWLVMIWKNKNWKNISLLTHQDPKYLFDRKDNYDCQIKFKSDLQRRINEFKEKVILWTIDICIVWWNYAVYETEFHGVIFDIKWNYCKSIELLRGIIQENFWLNPIVIGPILDNWFSDIILDTKNRRITQRRWSKEDATLINNIIFQSDTLEKIIPELDKKCTVNKVTLRGNLK